MTYRAVLAVPEFRALFLSQLLSIVGDQVTRIAVALLVFDRSGSSFAAAATYACSYLTWLVGGPVLAALSDRHPRRTVMITCDVARAGLVALLLVPALPLPAVFAVLVCVGLLAPPFDSARSATFPEVLPGDAYLVGNGLINSAIQLGQVLGFLVGGVLVAAIGSRGALLVDIATFTLSALVVRLAVTFRPAAQQAADQRGLLQDTARGIGAVLHTPQLRYLLAVAGLTAAASIAPEGLAVGVSAEFGHGAVGAGLLTACVPMGFVVGASLVLSREPAQRLGLLPGLAVLTLAPLVLTPWASSLPAVAALWLVAGAGGSLQVVASAVYVASTPPELRSRAYGVAGTTLAAGQGLSLLGAGALSEAVGPRTAVALVAGAGLVVLPLVLRTSPRLVQPA